MADASQNKGSPEKRRKAALAAPQFTLMPDASYPDQLADIAEALELPRQLAAIYDLLRHVETHSPTCIALLTPDRMCRTIALQWLAERLRAWNESRPDETAGVPVRVVRFHAARHQRRLHAALISELLLGVVDFAALSGEAFRRLVQLYRPMLGSEFVRAAAVARIERSASLGARAKADLGWVESYLDERDSPPLLNRIDPLLSPIWDELRGTLRSALKGEERVALLIDDLEALAPRAAEEFLDRALKTVELERVITIVAATPALRWFYERRDGLADYNAETGGCVSLVTQLTVTEDAIARVINLLWPEAGDLLWASVPASARSLIADVIASLSANLHDAVRLANRQGQLARQQACQAVGAERLELFHNALIAAVLHELLSRRHNWASLAHHAWGPGFLDAWHQAARVMDGPIHSDLLDSAWRSLQNTGEDLPPHMHKLAEQLRGNPQQQSLLPLLRDSHAWQLLQMLDNGTRWWRTPVRYSSEQVILEAAQRQLGGNELDAQDRVTSLNLAHLNVADLKVLRGYPNVRRLNISGTGVLDLSPLGNLIALEWLDASGTSVADIQPLETLAGLRGLRLDATAVTDLHLLERLAAIESLSLRSTPVRDLGPLARLEQLRELDVAETRVSELAPLRDLPSLRSLDLSGTNVCDVIPLSTMEQLQSLRLARTRVDFVEPLSRIASLRSLDLSRTHVEDASALAPLVQLTDLNLSGSGISSISGWLQELTSLERLDLSGTRVESLEGFEALNNLRTLRLAAGAMRSLAPVGRLRRLEELDISNCQATDLDVLRGCRSLRLLIVSPGQLPDSLASELQRASPDLQIQEAGEHPGETAPAASSTAMDESARES